MWPDRTTERPTTNCVAAAACVLVLVIGALATRFNDGLFVPPGASGTGL
jgi:hypothetical protein